MKTTLGSKMVAVALALSAAGVLIAAVLLRVYFGFLVF